MEKTSILEAIYETLQGKSFRAVDREIVRRGAEFYRVELEYEDGRKVVAVYDVAQGKRSFWQRIRGREDCPKGEISDCFV